MSASKLAERLKARSDTERLQKQQARAAAEELFRAAVLREFDRDPDADDDATDSEIAELESALDLLGYGPESLTVYASCIRQAIEFCEEFSDDALQRASERRDELVKPARARVEKLKAETETLEAEIRRANAEYHTLQRRRPLETEAGIDNIARLVRRGLTHPDIDERLLQIAEDQVGDPGGKKRREVEYQRQQESQARIAKEQRQERVAAPPGQEAQRQEQEQAVAAEHDPYADGAA